MKPVLQWVKANLLIVIFVAVILVVLPVSYVMSAAWGKGIRKNQAAKADAELKKVQGARVDYRLVSFDPASPDLTHKAEPNRVITEWFKENRERLAKEAGEIVQKAVAFNKGTGEEAAALGRTEHVPMVEGLFPKGATREEEQVKINEMEDRLLGKRGHVNPYQKLLDAIKAGDRADPLRLAEAVQDLRQRETEKITAGRRDLTEEEYAALLKVLAERRLAEYQARARQVSVYASLDSFLRDDRAGSAMPYGVFAADQLNVRDFFVYQWDLWLLEDLLAAVRLANTGTDGALLNVDQSVVKRIVKITPGYPEGMYGNTSDAMNSSFDATVVPTAATPGMTPLDPRVSITGRGMGAWNTLYDVRRTALKVVVSSARLPEFLAAVERTNFMTVTDVDLRDVDIWEELREGYYYGQEHVVEATVAVESVWLREWMATLVPLEVKQLLAYPDAGEAPAAEPAAGASPATPATRGAVRGGPR